jgi:hypothetical protein
MTKYQMTERDKSRGVCWQYALACLLDIKPTKVPNFPKHKTGHQADATRKWLADKFNKGLVFVPINWFAESKKYHRYNERGGPSGYSILIFDTNKETDTHAIIAKDGKYYYDPNDDVDHNDLTVPLGFFLVYDL